MIRIVRRMYYISKVHIQHYRSIDDLCFEIADGNLPVAICGQNNVGKTNTLRAINLFFHPNSFDPKTDIPVDKYLTCGYDFMPKIALTFSSRDGSDTSYELTREFSKTSRGKLSCVERKTNSGEEEQITETPFDIYKAIHMVWRIKFRYIGSIDVNTTELINDLTGDLLESKNPDSCFEDKINELRDAYLSYCRGLQEILDEFTTDMSETLHYFRENWDVRFAVPEAADRFRDMISDDVELQIDDKSGLGVSTKGSGLQRLAVILLNFELLKRMEEARKGFDGAVLCIDEPDIYLHETLQKKLYKYIKDCHCQVFYATHSKNFIEEENLSNVVYLHAEQHTTSDPASGRNDEYITTGCVRLNSPQGYKLICEDLGIEPVIINEPVLSAHNILVEGECDKKYLTGLADYFRIDHSDVKLIVAGGVTRFKGMLDVYNAFNRGNKGVKPQIHALFDDDEEGRGAYKSLDPKKKCYPNINVETVMIKNYKGEKSRKGNYEIEDLIYPEVICHIINGILSKRGMSKLAPDNVMEFLGENAFSKEGILKLCDTLTKFNNPSIEISVNTPDFKVQICKMFDITDPEIQKLLATARESHPDVEAFVKNLFDFSERTSPAVLPAVSD